MAIAVVAAITQLHAEEDLGGGVGLVTWSASGLRGWSTPDAV